MNKEVLKQYEELKRNKKIINAIEPDFFFEIVDYLLQENEKLKDKTIKYDKTLENLQKETVWKQKVKDKIEELKKKKDGNLLSVYNIEIEYCIRILKELIEEREEK